MVTYNNLHTVQTLKDSLEKRIADARLGDFPLPEIGSYAYDPPADLSFLCKEAAQIAKATAKSKEIEGTIKFAACAWADIYVSSESRERALRLLDQMASVLRAVGCRFDLRLAKEDQPKYLNGVRQAEPDRGFFTMHNNQYFVKIKERVKREEVIKPVEKLPKKSGRRRNTWEPDFSSLGPTEYTFTGTGVLQLYVFRRSNPYEIAKVEDTSTTRIEDKLLKLAQKIEAIALSAKLDAELRNEREVARRQRSLVWKQEKSEKDRLLKKIESLEQLAKNAERAESLRAFAGRISQAPNAPAMLKDDITVLLNVADWLDPLINKHWPEIDDVPDHDPYVGWY